MRELFFDAIAERFGRYPVEGHVITKSHARDVTHFGQTFKGEYYPTWPIPNLGNCAHTGRMKNRIRYWRDLRGLSRQALADKMSTGASQIVKLENGERKLTLEWMRRFSVALDVPIPDLLADDSEAVDETQVAQVDAKIIRECIIAWLSRQGDDAPWSAADEIFRMYNMRSQSRHKDS